jgi:hypothetical protein
MQSMLNKKKEEIRLEKVRVAEVYIQRNKFIRYNSPIPFFLPFRYYGRWIGLCIVEI